MPGLEAGHGLFCSLLLLLKSTFWRFLILQMSLKILVSHSAAMDAYANVEVVARCQANGNLPVFNQNVAKAKAYVTPGLQFFPRKFSQAFYDLPCLHKCQIVLSRPGPAASPHSGFCGRVEEVQLP